MKLAEREQQIRRVKSQSFDSEMISELEEDLRTEVSLMPLCYGIISRGSCKKHYIIFSGVYSRLVLSIVSL